MPRRADPPPHQRLEGPLGEVSEDLKGHLRPVKDDWRVGPGPPPGWLHTIVCVWVGLAVVVLGAVGTAVRVLEQHCQGTKVPLGVVGHPQAVIVEQRGQPGQRDCPKHFCVFYHHVTEAVKHPRLTCCGQVVALVQASVCQEPREVGGPRRIRLPSVRVVVQLQLAGQHPLHLPVELRDLKILGGRQHLQQFVHAVRHELPPSHVQLVAGVRAVCPAVGACPA
mmetsp:Transcript_56883/g.101519  ORF Transcript_56883/g.101519 Transcript_56883/m.101519 type:complete len:223 (+) Transcript_56883:88-756(+)